MLFEVRRTSCFNDEECPCEKCIPIKLVKTETIKLKTPEEFDTKFSKLEGKWLEVGFNHRINEQGFITRDREVEVYGIEINSLKELNHILTSENFVLRKELEKHEMGKPKS